jgi:predicted Zn-dependent protease
MNEHFQTLTEWLLDAVAAPEHFTFGYNAETSDFIRFNHAQVRQAGQVEQVSASLKLIDQGRQADLQLTLSGDTEVDCARLAAGLLQLRDTLPLLPEDPYLLINAGDWRHTRDQATPLPDAEQVVRHVCQAAAGLDLVGIYAAGSLRRGFASSHGAIGWHQANSFNLDWSLFHANGEAVKCNYAEAQWQAAQFEQRLQRGREQLAFLGQPLKHLPPGQYRAYLAPAAMDEIVGMLGWGGFSAQALASRSSPLQRLYGDELHLSPLVTFSEQVSDSLSPAFSEEGYPRRDLTLVRSGRAVERLVDSRSAAEYGLANNGAGGGEAPSALTMAAGLLQEQDILRELGTGLYISNLWYLNYSDRPAARMTGLTRFATFWVENGQIQAPVSTMRFDDSLYSLLGNQLEALTHEREMILSTSTYGERQTASSLLPGALIKKLTLTL